MQSIFEKKPGVLTCVSQQKLRHRREQRATPVFEDVVTGKVLALGQRGLILLLLKLRCLFIVTIVKP